jgi:hypothetical protein
MKPNLKADLASRNVGAWVFASVGGISESNP